MDLEGFTLTQNTGNVSCPFILSFQSQLQVKITRVTGEPEVMMFGGKEELGNGWSYLKMVLDVIVGYR
jgi:hypothetical protein